MPAALIQDKKELEKYSSAFTLSDMEIFIFPELIYALLLANIMSPQIWDWRKDPWFKDLSKMNFNRRVQRLKQFIIDKYNFNLDLETWGLTNKKKELERFKDIIDIEWLARSNALFGYTGDKYYFDIDIRRHFGLDKYTSDIIPYWKTETVAAMDAFMHKPNYTKGAGECVSLSVLYAAALYIVLQIPLENIFLLATPLHSQNFIIDKNNFITNNRRIVTKNMWFNGTELSDKARRALSKERVTIVSHISGYIHIDYAQATLDKHIYEKFTQELKNFLKTDINFEILANFLRLYSKYRKYFQFEYNREGHRYYLKAEKLYSYEHSSKNRVGDVSGRRLLEEVETEDFEITPYPDRYVVNVLEKKINNNTLVEEESKIYNILADLVNQDKHLEALLRDLEEFTVIKPSLPKQDKQYIKNTEVLRIKAGMSRLEIIEYLSQQRKSNLSVDLAFYAARQLDDKGWEPFWLACLKRNPVSVDKLAKYSVSEIYNILQTYSHESIYSGKGLATPDEVVNFERGDGLEKAICFINVILNKAKDASIKIVVAAKKAQVNIDNDKYIFKTNKGYTFSREIK